MPVDQRTTAAGSQCSCLYRCRQSRNWTELLNQRHGSQYPCLKLKTASLPDSSTDYVFDGRQIYQEIDLTNPLNVYGQSKLAGEEAIRENCDRHLILRTSWVYGSYGKSNFVTMPAWEPSAKKPRRRWSDW